MCSTPIKWANSKQQASSHNLKAFTSQKVSQLPNINIESVKYGYLGPGHGARGKRMWIYNDDDIAAMYETHSGNRTICLWCYTHARIWIVCTGKSKASSRSKFEQKFSDIDEICEKHKGEYSKDQLRAWAHMINMGKYESYNEAGSVPEEQDNNICSQRRKDPIWKVVQKKARYQSFVSVWLWLMPIYQILRGETGQEGRKITFCLLLQEFQRLQAAWWENLEDP